MKNINKIFNPLKKKSYGESHQGIIVVLKY
jgi:hypothetical protein